MRYAVVLLINDKETKSLSHEDKTLLKEAITDTLDDELGLQVEHIAINVEEETKD